MEKNIEYLTLITIAITFLLIFFSFMLDIINMHKFDEICKLYERKYGHIPISIKFWRDSGFFLKLQQTAFLFFPLIFDRNSFFLKGFNKADIDFIKLLPKELTQWIILKYFLLIAALLSGIISYLLINSIKPS